MDSAKVRARLNELHVSVSSNNTYLSSCGPLSDINECIPDKAICGHMAYCTNQIGSYTCTCHVGYTNITGRCEGE